MVGCGMLEITRGNPPVPANIENPIFIEGKRLLADPRLGSLAEPLRQKYRGEWKAYHQMQRQLDLEGQQILSEMEAADKSQAELEVFACKFKAEADIVDPQIAKFLTICKGQIDDQGTYQWCLDEQKRLPPLEANLNAMELELNRRGQAYSENVAQPVLRKADAWTVRVGNWEGKVLDFNQRLDAALAAAVRESETCDLEETLSKANQRCTYICFVTEKPKYWDPPFPPFELSKCPKSIQYKLP